MTDTKKMIDAIRKATIMPCGNRADTVYVPHSWSEPLLEKAKANAESIGSENPKIPVSIIRVLGAAVIFTPWVDEPIGVKYP